MLKLCGAVAYDSNDGGVDSPVERFARRTAMDRWRARHYGYQHAVASINAHIYISVAALPPREMARAQSPAESRFAPPLVVASLIQAEQTVRNQVARTPIVRSSTWLSTSTRLPLRS